MREINVRAWDKKTKEMSWFTFGPNEFHEMDRLACLGDPIWMLSTGLRDREGVEIFEGDKTTCCRSPYVVFWDTDMGRFRLKYVGEGPTFFIVREIYGHGLKVTGNTHEHGNSIKGDDK